VTGLFRFSCGHDVRGRVIAPDAGAREQAGPCPVCARPAEQRTEDARREAERQARLANVARLRAERDARIEAEHQAWLATVQRIRKGDAT
jgi:hypothetical protein